MIVHHHIADRLGVATMTDLSVEADVADVAEARGLRDFNDLVALTVSAALAVLALPFAYFPASTPRMVVVLCALPLGLAGLISAVRARDRCSVVATAIVLWALVCALMSGAPWVAALGAYGR